MRQDSFDVIVIGSGAAGLRAAISARTAGLSVCVVSKGSPGKSTCTGFSAGVMAGRAGTEKSDTHLQSTLTSGRGLNERELVEILVAEAPSRLDELMRWGIHADFKKRKISWKNMGLRNVRQARGQGTSFRKRFSKRFTETIRMSGWTLATYPKRTGGLTLSLLPSNPS